MRNLIHLRGILGALLLCLGLGYAMSLRADVYVLGDSLSDVGALGLTYTNPANTDPHTNGLVWPQYLGSSVSAYCGDAKNCTYSATTFYYTKAGNNFAVGGAGITFDSPDAKPATNYTSLPSQVKALLNGRRLAAGDIVAIWIGANDILRAARGPNSAASDVGIAVNTYRSVVSQLASQSNGAQIYLLTIPDIGKTPLGHASSDGGVLLTKLTESFNLGISTSPPAHTFVVDSNAMFADLRKIMATSATFCRKLIDPQHVCGESSNPSNSNINPPASVLFADPLHPSIAAHQYIARHVGF